MSNHDVYINMRKSGMAGFDAKLRGAGFSVDESKTGDGWIVVRNQTRHQTNVIRQMEWDWLDAAALRAEQRMERLAPQTNSK